MNQKAIKSKQATLQRIAEGIDNGEIIPTAPAEGGGSPEEVRALVEEAIDVLDAAKGSIPGGDGDIEAGGDEAVEAGADIEMPELDTVMARIRSAIEDGDEILVDDEEVEDDDLDGDLDEDVDEDVIDVRDAQTQSEQQLDGDEDASDASKVAKLTARIAKLQRNERQRIRAAMIHDYAGLFPEKHREEEAQKLAKFSGSNRELRSRLKFAKEVLEMNANGPLGGRVASYRRPVPSAPAAAAGRTGGYLFKTARLSTARRGSEAWRVWA